MYQSRDHQSIPASHSLRYGGTSHPSLSRTRHNLRRVVPETNHLHRSIFANPFGGSYERTQDPESEFFKTFEKFFNQVLTSQALISLFLIVLAVFTQLTKNFQIAVYIYIGFMGLYIIYLIHSQMQARTRRERGKTGYRIIQSIIIVLFLLTIRTGSLEETRVLFIIISTILLVISIGNMTSSYITNFSGLLKLTNQLNIIILLFRFLIFVQGIFLVVQLSLTTQISWYITFIPSWVMALILLLCIFDLFKKIFISYRILFWDRDVRGKKKGIVWAFGNLLGMLGFLLWGLILCSEEFNHPSGAEKPFLAWLFTICLTDWLSFWYGMCIKEDLLRASQELASILNTNEAVIADIIQAIVEKRIQNQQEEKKKDELLVKYVIKISSSYFKPANAQELSQLKSESIAEQSAEETPVEIGSPRMKRKPEENVVCVICFGNPPDAVLLDCGHGGICFKCAKELNKIQRECHMCRQPIKSLLKINLKQIQTNLFKVVRTIHNGSVVEA